MCDCVLGTRAWVKLGLSCFMRLLIFKFHSPELDITKKYFCSGDCNKILMNDLCWVYTFSETHLEWDSALVNMRLLTHFAQLYRVNWVVWYRLCQNETLRHLGFLLWPLIEPQLQTSLPFNPINQRRWLQFLKKLQAWNSRGDLYYAWSSKSSH